MQQNALHNLHVKQKIPLVLKTDTAHTMDYSDISRLSWLLQTFKTDADCQYSCILSRQLQTVKTITDCQ